MFKTTTITKSYSASTTPEDNSWDETFKDFDKAFEGFSDMFANWGSTIKKTCTATNGSSQAHANAVTTHSLQVNQSDITVTETTNGFTIHVDGKLIHTKKGA